MRRVLLLPLAAVAVALLTATGLSAQGGALQQAIVADLDGVAEKYLGLAEAMPQDKYTWRPGEGVRSVSEVFMHIAGANYGLPGMMGYSGEGMPSGEDMGGMEQVTDKSQVIKSMMGSFDYLREAILSVPDSRLDEPMNIFGAEGTVRSFLLLLQTHCHEHLGQSIAYARMNGVAPPWSGG
jgi:uncharacterized damage-inducible protein DinB